MVDVTKLIVFGFLSAFVNIIVSFLLLGLIDQYPALYWGLQITLLIIASGLISFFMKSNLDCIYTSMFQSAVVFVIFFSLLLLFTSFSEVLLNLLNFGNAEISGWSNIQRSFLGGLIISSIILSINLVFMLLFYNLKLLIKDENKLSLSDMEEQYYRKFESSKNAGKYHRITDKENFE